MPALIPIGEFSVKNGRIEVYETSSAFYIRDTITKQTACMGDGVNMFSDADGHPIPVASKAFYSELRRMVRTEKATLLEAYFGIYD